MSIHSDSPIVAGPLHVAWCAVSRQTATGQTLGAQERISIEQEALEAITITAAWQLGMDDEIGSIAAGKRADFVVLDRDPLGPAAEDLRTVVVVGTVLGGQYSPACSAAINPWNGIISRVCMTEPIPVTLLCGYRAGKTTLINSLLRQCRDRVIGVLVNDLGELQIDASLIDNQQGRTITLTNGSTAVRLPTDLMSLWLRSARWCCG